MFCKHCVYVYVLLSKMAAPNQDFDNNLHNLLFINEFYNNDEEVALLFDVERNRDVREQTYDPLWPKLELDELTRAQAFGYFRFDVEDIRLLTIKLGLPEKIVLPSRNTVTGEEGLCMLLRRLCYPNRLFDVEKLFGRPSSTLSLGIKAVVDILYQRHQHRLSDVQQPWLIRRLQTYADTISEMAPLTTCVGFVDGTVRPICRPTHLQRVTYNGHKRVHALKFQSVVVPDGMILDMFGPVEGRRHDCALLRESGLLDRLEELPLDRNGHRFCIYGDPAYPIREQLIPPYRGANLTAAQEAFNRGMSSVRECVEWQFGKILSQFAFLDFKKNLKVFLQPVAKYYLIGALLTNCHTCIYESQTGAYFGLQAPTLNEYLGLE